MIRDGKIESYSFISMRKAIVKSNKELEEDEKEQWLKEIPYDTRQLAVKQLASNIKTNFTHIKKKSL